MSKPSITTSTRVTRSKAAAQAACAQVLGKRPPRSSSENSMPAPRLSRSSSVASFRSTSSVLTLSASMNQADSPPNPKRARPNGSVIGINLNDGSNKENIAPLPSPEKPQTRRMQRRASTNSTTSASQISRTPSIRRVSALPSMFPQTPSTAFDQLSLASPPTSPPTSARLHHGVRALLRSTSNASYAISTSGREKECETIGAFIRGLENPTEDGPASKRVLYISGSPGSGKTALVNSLLEGTLFESDVKVISINCMANAEVDSIWDRVYEGLDLNRKTDSILAVQDMFAKGQKKCIIVLDEMDQLHSKKATASSVLSLATDLAASTVRVIGIANTHTLSSTEPTLKSTVGAHLNSVSMGSCLETIHFAPYTPSELLSILQARLATLPQEELQKMLPLSTLTLLTKKVASLTGDVRVLFEILRKAIDLATPDPFGSSGSISVAPSLILAAMKSCTPSTSSTAKASNSEVVTKVREQSFNGRLVLLALLLASKRSSSGLSLSPTSSPALPQTPTKRSPTKRMSYGSASSCETSSSTQAIDSAQLYSYYCALLGCADTFKAVSRPEFGDLLGVLETNGLVALSSGAGQGHGQKGFKRSSSFAGKIKVSNSVQTVSWTTDMREGEVARGLGIDITGAAASGETKEEDADVREEEVRVIWTKETARIRREVKVVEKRNAVANVNTFEDAMED